MVGKSCLSFNAETRYVVEYKREVQVDYLFTAWHFFFPSFKKKGKKKWQQWEQLLGVVADVASIATGISGLFEQPNYSGILSLF